MRGLEFSNSTLINEKCRRAPRTGSRKLAACIASTSPRYGTLPARKSSRGAAHHEDERGEVVSFDGARVRARVIGSEVYRCELVGSGKKFSGKCSCPAFSDWGFCKHLVATALTANSLGSEALE